MLTSCGNLSSMKLLPCAKHTELGCFFMLFMSYTVNPSNVFASFWTKSSPAFGKFSSYCLFLYFSAVFNSSFVIKMYSGKIHGVFFWIRKVCFF